MVRTRQSVWLAEGLSPMPSLVLPRLYLGNAAAGAETATEATREAMLPPTDASAVGGDALVIETEVVENRRASSRWGQRILRGDEVLATEAGVVGGALELEDVDRVARLL